MEDGLKSGAISIPGATVGLNPLDEINSITEYLNTFGVTVAERIKKLFVPLFDPATESLSPEVLAINQYIEDHAGYSPLRRPACGGRGHQAPAGAEQGGAHCGRMRLWKI